VSSLLILFDSMWQIELAIRQLLGTRKYTVSYRITSYCIVQCILHRETAAAGWTCDGV